MASIIELRKQELAAQIYLLMGEIQQVISVYSQYTCLNNDLQYLQTELDRIETGFDPRSDSPQTFEKCIEELKAVDRYAKQTRERGEAERRRLKRNATSSENAGTWSSVGAILGGIALGCGGCANCLNRFEGNLIHSPLFNGITGLVVGVIGGAVLGALIGALSGQMSEREDGDSASGLWWSVVGLSSFTVCGVALTFWMNTPTQVESVDSIVDQPHAERRPLELVSECDTPCRMEVRYGQRIENGGKDILIKFAGRKEWFVLRADRHVMIPMNKFSPGTAQFASPKNKPSVRVQILGKR